LSLNGKESTEEKVWWFYDCMIAVQTLSVLLLIMIGNILLIAEYIYSKIYYHCFCPVIKLSKITKAGKIWSD